MRRGVPAEPAAGAVEDDEDMLNNRGARSYDVAAGKYMYKYVYRLSQQNSN